MNPVMAAVVGLGVGVMIGLFVPFGIALVLTVGFIVVAMLMRMYATVALMALLGMIGVTIVKMYVWNQTLAVM
jgi:hypothetical protein